MNMLWYAAYGAHIHRDLFLQYIKGGRSPLNGRVYAGCRNTQDPIRDYALMINRELYFAKNADQWGGAVAFVRPEPSKSQTLGRGYLITEEQFLDIMAQENARRRGEQGFGFDYAYSEANPVSYLNTRNPGAPAGGGKLWYGRVLRIGTRESWPVLTVTAEWDGYADINAPGKNYIKTIAAGVQQLGKISPKSLVEYFLPKVGVKDRISRPVLERWLA